MNVAILIALTLSIVSSPPKNENQVIRGAKKDSSLQITWGTLDSTLMDNQGYRIWVSYRNISDTGVAIVSRSASHPEMTDPDLWVKEKDTTYCIGHCHSGSIYLAPHSSLFHVCGGYLENSLRHVQKKAITAQLVLKVGGPWIIPDSTSSVRLLPPDNMYLERFFLLMDSLEKNTAPGEMMAYRPSGKGSGRISWPNRVAQCTALKYYLDSLTRNQLADGLVRTSLGIRLGQRFCPDIDLDSIGGISNNNWPWMDNVSKCAADAHLHGLNEAIACLSARRDQDRIIKHLAKLDRQIPSVRPPYKFISDSDTVYVGWSTWFDGINGVFP